MKIWSYTFRFIRLCNSNNGQICFNMLSNSLLLLSLHFVTLQHVLCPIASGTLYLLLLLGLATLLPRPRILCILKFSQCLIKLNFQEESYILSSISSKSRLLCEEKMERKEKGIVWISESTDLNFFLHFELLFYDSTDNKGFFPL